MNERAHRFVRARARKETICKFECTVFFCAPHQGETTSSDHASPPKLLPPRAMFRKYHVENVQQLKSSVQRGIRTKISDQYPNLDDVLDDLIPKKSTMVLGKCADKVCVVLVDDEPLFFNHRDGPYFPTLRVLHRYPDMMPKLRVDKGAIKFVISGANIMCPGLTSNGATIHDEVDEDEPVAIYAEGKEHALAIGITKMSTADIKSVNKGIGVDLVHYLNDGLWSSTA